MEVRALDQEQFGAWTPEPARGEMAAAMTDGWTPWARGMSALEPSANDADCVEFLCTVGTKSSLVRELREGPQGFLGDPGSHISSIEEYDEARLLNGQRVELASLCLWTIEEHIRRDTLINVLVTHFKLLRPYVHSKKYDLANMQKIRYALFWWIRALTDMRISRLLMQPPQFECADPEAPLPMEGWSDDSGSSDVADGFPASLLWCHVGKGGKLA